MVLGHSTGKWGDLRAWGGGLGAGVGPRLSRKLLGSGKPSAPAAWGSSPGSAFKWAARSRKIAAQGPQEAAPRAPEASRVHRADRQRLGWPGESPQSLLLRSLPDLHMTLSGVEGRPFNNDRLISPQAGGQGSLFFLFKRERSNEPFLPHRACEIKCINTLLLLISKSLYLTADWG